MRATVAGSNRSAAYCHAQRISAPSSTTSSARSNFAVAARRGPGRTSRPGSAGGAAGAARCENTTWNTGLRPGSRGTASASTRRSKGSSWCSQAPSVASRTRHSSSPNAGSPEQSVRSATVLTRKPTTPSSSGRVRPARGAPTTTSSSPV